MKIEEECETCANKILCSFGNMRKCEYKNIVEEATKAREKRNGRYMKIIFDNEGQKKKFIKALGEYMNCPGNFGMEEGCVRCEKYKCEKCWEDAVEIEVRERALNAKGLKDFLENLEKEKM